MLHSVSAHVYLHVSRVVSTCQPCWEHGSGVLLCTSKLTPVQPQHLLSDLGQSIPTSLAQCVAQCCRALLVVVNPSASAAKEVSPAAAEKHWRDAVSQLAEEAGPSQSQQDPGELQFDVIYVQSNADACKAIHRALSSLR